MCATGKRGFTLIETVVATAILMLVGISLYTVQKTLNSDRANIQDTIIRENFASYLRDVVTAFPPPTATLPTNTPFSVQMNDTGATYTPDPMASKGMWGFVQGDAGTYSHSITRLTNAANSDQPDLYRISVWQTQHRSETEKITFVSR